MLKLNLGCGKFPMHDFVNMDSRRDLASKEDFQKFNIIGGWRWQEGFPDLADESVDAITESHSLMYCTIDEYPNIFKEIKRVLKKRGIFRITEDNCEYPEAHKFGLPWGNPASITGPSMMRKALSEAGFFVIDIGNPDFSFFRDKSLIQQHHGTPPRVFHIEAAHSIEDFGGILERIPGII